jgi:hypothetical protein
MYTNRSEDQNADRSSTNEALQIVRRVLDALVPVIFELVQRRTVEPDSDSQLPSTGSDERHERSGASSKRPEGASRTCNECGEPVARPNDKRSKYCKKHMPSKRSPPKKPFKKKNTAPRG